MVDADPQSTDSRVSTSKTDDELFASFDPALERWWKRSFDGTTQESDSGYFTPPQRGAIPEIRSGNDVLIAAPTGSGKTLASFSSVINDLLAKDRRDELSDTIYCIYVSPMRSLANDIHRNLERPLAGVHDIRTESGANPSRIRHAIRHGDTDTNTRRRMLATPPHILNTTPETLAILLNSPKFRIHLESVEYVIVDEIHSLADNKRGAHLSIALERLRALADTTPVRIGCSATIEPLERVATFLAGVDDTGNPRECAIVDRRFQRDLDLELTCPVADLVGTPRKTVRSEMYSDLHDLIQSHETTIVFTNTRSGAERVLHQLRERYPEYTEATSGCHHGSLAHADRTRVETALKEGTFDVVTTSTSLELGIDMSSVDLVVQLGSPKSVRSLLQRVGRSGHSLNRTVRGRVFVLDRDELLECAVMVERAMSGWVDSLDIPDRPLDVVIQHVYGMAITRVRPEESVRSIITQAAPFVSLTDEEWELVIRYLTGSYPGLEEHHVYPKIWRDRNDPPDGPQHHDEFPAGTRLIGKRGRLARMIYLTNVGTIPQQFACSVRLRDSDDWVGTLDESYLDRLSPGDVFLLGGTRYAFRYRRGGVVYVDPTTDRPTIPSWYSERLPMAPDLADEIASEQDRLRDAYRTDGRPGVRAGITKWPISENVADAVTQLVSDQLAYLGTEGMAGSDRIVIEEERDQDAYVRRYYVHSIAGRRCNDGLARLLAMRCRHVTGADVTTAVTDTGFVLSMPLNRRVDPVGLLKSVDPDAVPESLLSALRDTELYKRYFRMNAARSLLILPEYKGRRKSAKQQQVSSEMLLGVVEEFDEFAVVRETHRELIEDVLDGEAVSKLIAGISAGDVDLTHVRVQSPSPFAFGLATLSSSDTVLDSEEISALRTYHRHVKRTIADERSAVDETGSPTGR